MSNNQKVIAKVAAIPKFVGLIAWPE